VIPLTTVSFSAATPSVASSRLGLVVNTAGLGRLHSRARRLHRAFTEEAHRARAAAAAEVARAHDELAVAKEVAEAAASSARREAAAASADDVGSEGVMRRRAVFC
jgi:hypothetical protein